MIIETDGLTMTSEQQDDIEKGLIAMGDPDGTLLLTGDFEQSIRNRTGLKHYSAERGPGGVAAKTIEDHVIINASVLGEPAHGGLERLTAHEAGHVLMNLREENSKNYHHLAATQWQWYLIGVAVKGMEEYRIERRLAELGYDPASPTALDHWDIVLFETNATLVESVLKVQTVDSLFGQVLGAADLLVTTMAYTIGGLVNRTSKFDVKSLPEFAQENWNDFAVTTWDQRVELYEGLPTCSEPISALDWEGKIKQARSLEMDLFESFGWELSGDGQRHPEAFRRTGSDELSHQRIARYEFEIAGD